MFGKGYVSKHQEKSVIFDYFCKNHGWTFESFSRNPKNPKQYLGQCIDELGMPISILITESGRYVRLLGDRKWEEVPYAKEAVSEDPGGTC